MSRLMIDSQFIKRGALMSPKALICDFDGTLFDAKEWMIRPAQFALKQLLDLDVPYEELGNRFSTGIHLEVFFSKYARSEKDIAQLVALHRKRQDLPEIMATVLPYPTVLETIVQLYDRGVKLGIATSRGTRGTMHKTLFQKNLLWRFGSIVCLADVTKAKPDPECVFKVMDELWSDPSNTFFVGDTVSDLRAGKAAGVTTICALYGYGDEEELRAIGADHFIEEFSEVVDIVLA